MHCSRLEIQAVEAVVTFYVSALEQANQALTDGTNQKPHYSLRTLCRALETARLMCGVYGYQRSLYEGVCAAFLTALGRDSYAKMQVSQRPSVWFWFLDLLVSSAVLQDQQKPCLRC